MKSGQETVFEAVYLGAFIALGIGAREQAPRLAEVTRSQEELEAAVAIMAAAKPTDRVWPALDWLRRRRADGTASGLSGRPVADTGLSYREQMTDAGRGHLVRGDE